MQGPAKKMHESRGMPHEVRRVTGRSSWLVVDGKPIPHPQPLATAGIWVAPPHQQDAGLLKQIRQSAPPHALRFLPYQRERLNFSVHEIDRCLYGKQELRVVRIGNNKLPPSSLPPGGNKPSSASSAILSTSSNEDKKKPAKWCDMCQEVRFGECPHHGPLPSPHLSVYHPGGSYAISTFPEEVGLCISTIPLAGYGVFANLFIPKGTWIGPYEGKKISVEDGLKQIRQGDAPFLWEIYENFGLSHFLDATDENSSSWMRFIQCARHPGEQNMFVFQYNGSIYYRVYKDIAVGSELLLWYDDKYPQYLGIPYEIRDMLTHSVENIQAPLEVSKMADFDPGRHHGETLRGHPSFLQSGKVILGRNEPPRIPSNAHHHVSSAYAPSQPPTLSQAPRLSESRHSRPPIHGLPSPRQTNPAYRRDVAYTCSNILRSQSAEDLHNRSIEQHDHRGAPYPPQPNDVRRVRWLKGEEGT